VPLLTCILQCSNIEDRHNSKTIKVQLMKNQTKIKLKKERKIKTTSIFTMQA